LTFEATIQGVNASRWLRRIGFVSLFLLGPIAASVVRSWFPDEFQDEISSVAIVAFAGCVLLVLFKERAAIAENFRQLWREL
jgi:hypothetical protein